MEGKMQELLLDHLYRFFCIFALTQNVKLNFY